MDEQIKREECKSVDRCLQLTNAMPTAFASWLRAKRAQLALIGRSSVWLDDSAVFAAEGLGRLFNFLKTELDSTRYSDFLLCCFHLFVVVSFHGRPIEPIVTME